MKSFATGDAGAQVVDPSAWHMTKPRCDGCTSLLCPACSQKVVPSELQAAVDDALLVEAGKVQFRLTDYENISLGSGGIRCDGCGIDAERRTDG